MKVNIVSECERELRLQSLQKVAETALRSEGIKKNLTVIISSDQTIIELNKRYFSRDSLTDVISFSLNEKKLLGEVYVCLSEAERLSRQLSRPLEAELALYIIHGILHLAGYDDRTDRDFNKMHRREDELLRKLGYPPANITR